MIYTTIAIANFSKCRSAHYRINIGRHGRLGLTRDSAGLDVRSAQGSVGVVAGMDMNDVVERILTTYDTITVVGASADPYKPAHGIPAFMQRHGWRIIPVNLRGGELLGETAYRTLAEIGEPDGFVDVFGRRRGRRRSPGRPSPSAPPRSGSSSASPPPRPAR